MLREGFIESDILSELEKALDAFYSVSDNILSYTMCEYFLQSVFLQMAGYQEQKCKLIFWNVATTDPECRYKVLKGDIAISEASNLSDKEKIYEQIYTSSNRLDIPFTGFTLEEKSEMVKDIKLRLKHILQNSVIGNWIPREIAEFLSFGDKLEKRATKYLDETRIFKDDNLFKEAADRMWRHRNRCAHNLLSYQDNIPDLRERLNDKNNINNYPTRFFILALIDNALKRRYMDFIRNLKRRV